MTDDTTAREAQNCPSCNHRHSARLGGICIGCPCPEGDWGTEATDD